MKYDTKNAIAKVFILRDLAALREFLLRDDR
jgi:hypothetical protein